MLVDVVEAVRTLVIFSNSPDEAFLADVNKLIQLVGMPDEKADVVSTIKLHENGELATRLDAIHTDN